MTLIKQTAYQKAIRFYMAFFVLVFSWLPLVAQAETDCTAVTEISQTECEYLVTLYNSTSGLNWGNISLGDVGDNHGWHESGWNVTNTPCSWDGISCNDGHITAIILSKVYMNGSLPDWSALTHLEKIHLELSSFSELNGPIPDWSALTTLKHIELVMTATVYGVLNGPIPEWSALTSLEYIRLNINQLSQLSGPIPDWSALTSLEYINLNSNKLSGAIPDWSALTSLEQIGLSNNQLSGAIPDWSALTSLEQIGLSNNQLSGSIPDWNALTSLEYIDLNSNQLSGSIPDWNALTSLEYIDLSHNQLSGSIPDWSALTSLKKIYLSNNQLSGSIPDVSALSTLEWLFLNNNRLSGEIPLSLLDTKLGDSAMFVSRLNLDNNCLTAPSDPTLIAFLNSSDSGLGDDSGWATTQNNCDYHYPIIKPIFSAENNGSIANTTAKFYGGISVNNDNTSSVEGGAFALAATNVKQLKVDESGNVTGDTITVEGVIIPDSAHIGQTADIIVVGLYTMTNDSCNPNQGDYYMLKEPGRGNLNNNYCAWIAPDSDYCHHSMSDQPSYYYEWKGRTPRSPSQDEYFSRWGGQLHKLEPLYSSVLLSEEPLMLTVEEGMVLYQDKPRYTGHVCINFGYRLQDGTLVFNGNPIQFSVE